MVLVFVVLIAAFVLAVEWWGVPTIEPELGERYARDKAARDDRTRDGSG